MGYQIPFPFPERSTERMIGHMELRENQPNDMREDSQTEPQDGGRRGGRKRSDNKFLQGLFCGVLLVLICMTGSLLYFEWKMSRLQTGMETQEETSGTELELDTTEVKRKLREIETLVNTYYLEDIDSQAVEESLYQGLVSGLDDPYSVYYTQEELETLEESTSGSYSGIGVTLSQDPDTGEIYVVSCFEDTPASEAGLQPGDILTGINGDSADGMDLSEFVSRVRTDEGDSITLTLQRDGETQEMEIVRRDISVPTVEAEMLEDGIGYLQILEFDSVTADQFTEKLEELESEGMEKLIVDVRDNPGGVLQVVCDILDELLPEGLIVYTEDKNGEREEYTSDEEHQFTKPLAVLINENSASASEIFAGAVKDYGLGTLVGKTTFGKGIVQRIFYLDDGTGIKLTVAKYYTPNGTDIHQKGIDPDVEVDLPEELQNQAEISQEEDTQLQEAISILSEEES